MNKLIEEIQMWRSRYLTEKGMDPDSQIGQFFLYSPCIFMSENGRSDVENEAIFKTPESALKLAQEFYENK